MSCSILQKMSHSRDSMCVLIPRGIALYRHNSLKHGDLPDSKSIFQVKLEHFIFKWQMLTGGRDSGIMAGGRESTVIDLTTLACLAHSTFSSLATCAKKHLLQTKTICQQKASLLNFIPWVHCYWRHSPFKHFCHFFSQVLSTVTRTVQLWSCLHLS